MKLVRGGISFPKGFYAVGKKAGIKLRKKDLSVIYSESPANAAGCFTLNTVKAAPVIICMERLKKGKAQAIVANSGCANACTGKKGLDDAKKIAATAAKELKVDEQLVLVASTGLIGSFLPVGKIKRALHGIMRKLGKSNFFSHAAAEAIMTTDDERKELALRENGVRFGAMAKGAGMIMPNMATMFCFITTDAIASSKLCERALKKAVEKSFNRLSIDGDMSTNDSAILLANGASGKKLPDRKFFAAIEFICTEMAKKMAEDGEGATKMIEAEVLGVKTEKAAKAMALSIVNSALVKSAVFGEDPNWGRVLAAIGSTKEKFNPEKAGVFLNGIAVARKGVGVKFNKIRMEKALAGKKVKITVKLGEGRKKATAWGCDLTYEYVEINAAYHN
ncbi:MAG: bifunctional glutamate N-acetyltransferase/amino-acid acetyltransferase ArgJ [Candidatus Diapherotrites archaeon]